jgi:hypothetical protein
VDLDHPSESLILQKPSQTVDHDGGQRFPIDSWEYRLLLRWIETGARHVPSEAVEFVRLQLEPEQIVFKRDGQSQPVTAVAYWSDGSQEDVTALCRFRTNDESIATVNESGLVAAAGKGDTHIVAFYDNGVTATSVVLPVSDLVDARFPDVPAPTQIDKFVTAKLRMLGMIPSEICSDAEFLRRLSLDLTGTLPAPGEITAFLADTSLDKRARKIDELLSRPAFAAWWTTRLCDLMGNSERNLPEGGEQALRREKSAQWYDWIYRRVAENTPYDELVRDILLATSRTSDQSDQDYFAEMSSYFRQENPADFSTRKSMPYFWTANRFTPPQPLRFSYAFLGIRLECAQCHKHPYDQWTKDDYDQFQLFFDGIKQTTRGGDLARQIKQALELTADQDSGQYKNLFAKHAREGRVVPWQEVTAPRWNSNRGRNSKSARRETSARVITPKLLGGEEVIAQQYNDPREPLVEWLRAADNPYFARSLVNRVWANYFGRGIIEPPDDLSLANPPSNTPLLDYLTREFVQHGYDLRWLHGEITNSRTYQLSWRPNETNRLDERNFSHALLRRLPAEVTYDAVAFATGNCQVQSAMQKDAAAIRQRAIGISSGYSRNYDGSYALKLFGKPERAVNCDCERSNEPSLLQTIFFRNDAELLALLDRKNGWLEEVVPQDADGLKVNHDLVIQGAYLRTFGRTPSEVEMDIGREYLARPEGVRESLKDLVWALLNSKEFLLNH